MTTSVLVHPDAPTLAAAAAARLVTRLADLQAAGRTPAVALTGGGIGIETLAAVRRSPAAGAVEWRRVEFFFGDERFVPATSDDRNEKQAREALLDSLELDPGLVHPMAASDGVFGPDVDAAAADYATLLAGRPPLDIVLLGMGGEGHIASIFPASPAASATADAVAVRDCPKPPPTRISMTFRSIGAAAEVWMIVAGAAKAEAVAAALGGAAPVEVPAAGARGREQTLWLLDRDAAGRLPGGG